MTEYVTEAVIIDGAELRVTRRASRAVSVAEFLLRGSYATPQEGLEAYFGEPQHKLASTGMTIHSAQNHRIGGVDRF